MPEEEKTNNAAEGAKAKSDTKLPLIIGMVLLQIIAAAAIAYFVILPKFEEVTNPAGGEQVAEKPEPYELGYIYTISDLTVNPKGSMGHRFAVFEIALEVKEQPVLKELEKYHPIIVDKFLSYFRTKSVEELTTPVHIRAIKEDLKLMVNEILAKKAVINLYFTRYVLE